MAAKTKIESFMNYLKSQPASAGAPAPAKPAPPAGTPAGGGGKAAPPTSNDGLSTVEVHASSDGGKTDEAFPKKGVKYSFYTDVANGGKKPSGQFFVRFTLTGDKNWEGDSDIQDGLKPGASPVRVVLDYGELPANAHVVACIYSPDEPDTPIDCSGSTDVGVGP